eukprot:GGOE01003224.1.p1 GENE.GGOE01003224.1~~GGOE01003224.1.p1  ORF type:complete len:418 (+),score=122.17 GGOE01003224.1:161-1255(+)
MSHSASRHNRSPQFFQVMDATPSQRRTKTLVPGLQSPSGWFTHNQRLGFSLSPYNTPAPSSRTSTPTISVLGTRCTTASSCPFGSLPTRLTSSTSPTASMEQLIQKVKKGERWTLAPADTTGIHSAAQQMTELEEFHPFAGIRGLMAQKHHRVYKLGKWSAESATAWDYRLEQGHLGWLAEDSVGAKSLTEPIEVFVQITDDLDDGLEDRLTGACQLQGRLLPLVPSGTVGLRFSGVGVPQGAHVHFAKLELVPATSYRNPTKIQIEAEASDDAPRFQSEENAITCRPRASSRVVWSPTVWRSQSMVETVNLREMVQEVVNRPGWGLGGALVFFLTTLDGGREIFSCGLDGSDACGLRIKWSPV